jgi:hypothetical protein
MTITTQWIAFGVVAVALFVTGMLWPKADDCASEERAEHPTGDHQSRPQRRRDEAAALASAGH